MDKQRNEFKILSIKSEWVERGKVIGYHCMVENKDGGIFLKAFSFDALNSLVPEDVLARLILNSDYG